MGDVGSLFLGGALAWQIGGVYSADLSALLGCFFCVGVPCFDTLLGIARRMAALGINCVRFHHMDNQYKPRGIWDPAYKDHQHIDAEQLDRLDWMVYQLSLIHI